MIQCLVRRATKVTENKEKSGSIDDDDDHMGQTIIEWRKKRESEGCVWQLKDEVSQGNEKCGRLTIVHRHFLHEGVVDGAIPQQERGSSDGKAVSERDSHVSRSVGDACKQHQHTGQEVEGECSKERQPDMVDELDGGLVCLWDLGRD